MNVQDHPLLTVIERVRTGDVSIGQGERLAADKSVIPSLSFDFIGQLSEAAFIAAQQGQWFEALAVQRLLVAATDHLPPAPGISETYRMQQVAAGDFVEIARAALSAMPSPDGRVLWAARLRGERNLEAAAQVGHTGTVSSLHFRLGTLHLDPYRSRASPLTGPLGGEPAWQARLVPEFGQTVLGVGSEYWPMPSPVDALQYAAHHLRAAYGGAAPKAAKALAQTLDSLAALGQPVDRDELLGACRTALQALDPQQDSAIFEEVSEILARRS
jgi:hypothetical protein